MFQTLASEKNLAQYKEKRITQNKSIHLFTQQIFIEHNTTYQILLHVRELQQ